MSEINVEPPAPAKAPIHLFVGVLAGGGKIWDVHGACMVRLKNECERRGIKFTRTSDSATGVDRARNKLVEAARAWPTPPTHFMFIDDDIMFDPMDVIRMLQSNLDIVAAVYPRKDMDWGRLAAAVRAGVPDDQIYRYATSFIFNGWAGQGVEIAFPDGTTGSFLEVDEVGTGFMLMKMSVIEAVIAAYKNEIAYLTDYAPRGVVHNMTFSCERDPRCELVAAQRALLKAAVQSDPYEHDLDLALAAENYQKAIAKGDAALGRYLTEDYAFCRRAQMIGYKIHVYTECMLGHLGGWLFQGRLKDAIPPTWDEPMDCNMSEIIPNLWQGSPPPGGSWMKDRGFSVLVQCPFELQSEDSIYTGVTSIHCPFGDDLLSEVPEDLLAGLRKVAKEVARRVRDGQKVLVHCAQGLNRSGLVVGLTLKELGHPPEEAVKLIQSQRPGALFNRKFVEALLRAPYDPT